MKRILIVKGIADNAYISGLDERDIIDIMRSSHAPIMLLPDDTLAILQWDKFTANQVDDVITYNYDVEEINHQKNVIEYVINL